MTEHPIYRRSFMGLIGAIELTPVAGDTADAMETGETDAEQSFDQQSDEPQFPNELVVMYDRDEELASVQAAAMGAVRTESQRAHLGRVNTTLGFFKINLVGSVTTTEREAVKTTLLNQSAIEHVNPPREVRTAYRPTDPGYGDNWKDPERRDPNIQGPQNNVESIGAEIGWKVTRAKNMTIAIVELDRPQDTHEDLRFSNPAGVCPHFEAVRSGERLLPPPRYERVPRHKHPTQVGGVAAARHNNQKGIAGTTNAKLFSVPCSRENQPDQLTDLATGIEFAATRRDVDIINVSACVRPKHANKMEIEDSGLQNAISVAENNNTLVVAAAGNITPKNQSSAVRPPATDPRVVAVSNTHLDGEIAEDSTRGYEIDVTAPGIDILTTDLGDRYVRENGTSYAAPVVSGVAALGLAVRPHLTPAELRDRLRETADSYTGEVDEEGDGRVNAAKMIAANPDDIPTLERELSRPDSPSLETSEQVSITQETAPPEDEHLFQEDDFY